MKNKHSQAQYSQYVACPKCKKDLFKEDEGQLHCSAGHIFKVVDGLPSFSGFSEFDSHWKLNELPEIPDKKIQVAIDFLQPILEEMSKVEKLSVLDVGCGDGVHIKVLNDQMPSVKGMAIDISRMALKTAKRRDDMNAWSFFEADAVHLPFKSGVFDVAFSYGVIAYTQDPRHAFKELTRVTKPGGLVGVWIFADKGTLSMKLFKFIRGLIQFFGRWFGVFLANMMVPFLGILPTASKVSLSNANWAACREVIMVNLMPEHLVFPTESEVKQWFQEEGLSILNVSEHDPIAIWGKLQEN